MRLLIVGGSDAGISAGLRARAVDPDAEVTLVVADSYPNFSICGIPYHVGGDVPDWRDLAHRTRADLEAAGLRLRLGERAVALRPEVRELDVACANGRVETLRYDACVVGTGARAVRPPISGLDALGPADGVHLLHGMDDTFALTADLDRRQPSRAVVVGAGYVGLEMAEALVARGLDVSVIEALPQVLGTLDRDLGAVVAEEMARHGVVVRTGTPVGEITRGERGGLRLGGAGLDLEADVVVVAGGVRPDVGLAHAAGVPLGAGGALAVDETMATGIEGLWAAGDCVQTHHRLLGEPTYLPLGTTAHKQGRVAGANAVGGSERFAGSLGTQVVKVFDLVAARTGLRDDEARRAGFDVRSVTIEADDHKAYYPGARTIRLRLSAERGSGRLLGVQMVGAISTAVAKRIDVAATAIASGLGVADLIGLDLSYTPPLGSPWDPLQVAAERWEAEARTAG